MGLFRALGRFLGSLSPAHIVLVTLTSGAKRVGTDPAGNRYYRAKPRKGYKRERRWVLYKGAPEASKVPPEWHGWLHHQTDTVPSEDGESFRRPWQKPHTPNLTGTAGAYRPQGHILNSGVRAAASADYEAWQPPRRADAATRAAKSAAKSAAKARPAKKAKAPAKRRTTKSK
jgi:NADH:ubiquinone oxidoreductase subunit